MTVNIWAYRTESGDPFDFTGPLAWEAEEINVSNVNAAELLRLLGYVELVPGYGEMPSEAGEATPDEFLGRILIARGLLDVATTDAIGTPTVTEGGPGSGKPMVIDCGRRPGYLADRLAQLEELAQPAKAHDAIVTWS